MRCCLASAPRRALALRSYIQRCTSANLASQGRPEPPSTAQPSRGTQAGRRTSTRSKATVSLSAASTASVELGLNLNPFEIIQKDLKLLSGSLKQLVQSDHPVLTTVAEYLLCGSEGKRVRPSLVLLMSRACSEHGTDPNVKQQRLAEITEMIHTASLLHDDVVDLSVTRRGQPTAHVNFGNKVAILGGDFLLARASVQLARLQDVEVIEMLSTVIEHLVKGEIMQMRDSWECVSSLDHYMEKTFMKTGSLIAHSCKAAALLGNHSPEVAHIAYEYGRHVGMAFQLVDDLLDLEGDNHKLGKSAQADLKQGVTTAPLIFALEKQHGLEPLMKRKFSQDGDVEMAYSLIADSDAAAQTRTAAEEHCRKAIEEISKLGSTPAVEALAGMTHKVLNRQK